MIKFARFAFQRGLCAVPSAAIMLAAASGASVYLGEAFEAAMTGAGAGFLLGMSFATYLAFGDET